jgi:hypothetical protein
MDRYIARKVLPPRSADQAFYSGKGLCRMGANLILVTQLFSTLAMVGLIWFVQIVHYPLFGRVGREAFAEYERVHQQRTTTVVAPLMLLEAVTAALLFFWRPAGVSPSLPWAGIVLLALIWGATFFWQVPAHEKLAVSFEPATHLFLVRSNWLRTGGWTARGLIVCAMCWQAISTSR